MIKNRKHLLLGIFSFCMVSTLSFLLAKNMAQSNATMAGFSAGNIMSDYVMGNYNSMTEAQIQAFLKSKNSCNDTATYKASQYPAYQYHIKNGHFVCMADEREYFGGESAAHIIWQAAQDYHINPQVLIVLLQKEQGLVTDTWPNINHQYRSATGYGCPDTAACDSQYYGFKNQVRNTAELYRWILDHGSRYYPIGWNTVRYSPNAACGSSQVYIENNATAALYQYTPYQPNQSAINAGYGSGDACGAYGNRNFYNYFTDWFGDTHSLGYQSLDVPRYFELANNANRIQAGSSNIVDSLIAGTQLRFSSKIYTKDGWCFRTDYTTNYNIDACVLQKNLKEIQLVYEEVPKDEQVKVILPNTHKTYIKGKNAIQNFSSELVRTFVKRTTFLGTTYYITEYDAKNSNSEYGVPEQYLRDSYQNLIPAKEIVLKQATDRINPKTKQYSDTLQKYKILKVASYIKTNNQTYYRTEYSTLLNQSAAFLSSAAKELAANYQPFEVPRSFKVKRNAERLSPNLNENYDIISKGSVIKFTSKIFINNQWYYRTEYCTDNNLDLAISASDLEEL